MPISPEQLNVLLRSIERAPRADLAALGPKPDASAVAAIKEDIER